jgi:hypothetical protein
MGVFHVHVYVYFHVLGILHGVVEERGSRDLFLLLFLCVYMHILYIWDLAVDLIYFNLIRGYTATKSMCVDQSHEVQSRPELHHRSRPIYHLPFTLYTRYPAL